VFKGYGQGAVKAPAFCRGLAGLRFRKGSPKNKSNKQLLKMRMVAAVNRRQAHRM
jgi:hypothetical protein